MNNGRVIKIDEGCFNKLPMFYNNVASGTFKHTALKGIQQNSQLSLLFFSKENIDILQKQLRYITQLNSRNWFYYRRLKY